MSGLSTTIRIGDGDRIAVRERTTEPGCAITAFCGDVLIFLSAEKEAELLAALIERAPKLPLRAAQAVDAATEASYDSDLAIPRVDGLRRVMVEDFAPAVAEWLEQDRDRFLIEADALKRARPADLVSGVVIDLADAIARLPKAGAASPQDAA